MISVIIPVFNASNTIEKLFKSIQSQTLEKNNFEIIFVDNNSNDDSAIKIKKFINDSPKLKILYFKYTEKMSSYAARNYGLTKANGDYYAFTDSDCEPKQDWLSKINEYLKKDSSQVISGQVDLTINDPSNVWEHFDKLVNMRNDLKSKDNSAATANVATSKFIFDSVGEFQEVTSGGDIEWTKRAVKMGYKLSYKSDVIVLHPCRNSFKQIRTKTIRLGIGYGQRIKYEGKNIPWNIVKYLLRIFYLKTNLRVSSHLYKNVGIISVLYFNLMFTILRMLQLGAVIKGLKK